MPTLHWLDRSHSLRQSARVPCRLLRADPRLSAGDKDSGNLLLQGDNLHALKALMPYYRGEVKCIFIDPPYNTKSAFEHYQDSLEHSQWLDMMYPRLELLRELLAEDGSLWVTIDDNEAHYLKVIMDEIFGRGNFVSNVIWQKSYGPRSNAHLISDSHDHVLVYAKNKGLTRFDLLERSDEQKAKYQNPDKDPRGSWKPENSSISLLSGQRGRQFAQTGKSDNLFEIVGPDGTKHWPPKGRCWVFNPLKYKELVADGRIVFGRDGTGRPSVKKFLSEISAGMLPQSVWLHDEVGHNQESSREIRNLFPDNPFSTPKPERLLQRIIRLATNPGDLVLDSFLGSGTTAAVAHKMNRRYIGIEMGEHAKTHCAVRLKKVIEGEQGGISRAVNWHGGGGFRFYTLGAELFDADGNIHPQVRFADLAAYLWFMHTRTPYQGQADSPLLGIHEGTAYYLLYNGILKDRRSDGGNILTRPVLQHLPPYSGKRVIHANGSRLGEKALHAANLVFRPIPWALHSEGRLPGHRTP